MYLDGQWTSHGLMKAVVAFISQEEAHSALLLTISLRLTPFLLLETQLRQLTYSETDAKAGELELSFHI
jgi:hypothetical protein